MRMLILKKNREFECRQAHKVEPDDVRSAEGSAS